MPIFSRRAFLGALATSIPAVVLVRRAHAAAVDELASDPDTLHSLAEAVLPSELSATQLGAIVAGFQRWIAGYRDNAELLHGYGTSALERARPTPATRWAAQLQSLGRPFAQASIPERQRIVQRELDTLKAERIPPIGRAPHVALAVLAHFYGSADATDLCYRASIGKQTCRPLAAQARRPLPLAHRGPA